jgi:hypothetical protein
MSDDRDIRRALEQAAIIAARIDRLRGALRAVLMFYSPSPWTPEMRDRWQALTGHADATSKNLCDVVRGALAETL